MYRLLTMLAFLSILGLSSPGFAQESPESSPPPASTDAAESSDSESTSADTNPSQGEAAEEKATEEKTTEPADPAPDEQSSVDEDETTRAVAPPFREVPAEVLAEENAARTVTNRYAMLALGAWALGNFGWATVGLLTNQENPGRAFHLTNAAWNLVNGTIAVFGYFGSINESHADYDLIDTLVADHNVEKTFLVNGALDLAYIFGGAFLTSKGNLDQQDWMIGAGRSVMLQGAFLLAFDATMFVIHHLRRKSFEKSVGR